MNKAIIMPLGALRLKKVTSERQKETSGILSLPKDAVGLFSEQGTFLASAHVAGAFGHFCSKSVIQNVIILFIGSIVLLLSPTATFAQTSSQGLKVTPVIIPLQLSPGKEQIHKIELENLSKTPLPLRAQFSDFEPASEDGGYILEQQANTSLAHWIRLSQKEFILAPGEKKAIQLMIQAPSQLPLGGYSTLLFFEPVIPKTANTTTIQSRIGILILGDVGVYTKDRHKADVLSFSLGGLLHETPSLPLLLRVQNITLHHLNTKPVLSIEPLFGNKTEYPLEEKYIFPGKVRRWTHTIIPKEAPPLGIYNAVVVVSTGNGDQEIAKTTVIVFPLTKALGILIPVILIVLIVRKRTQIRQAISVLLKG